MTPTERHHYLETFVNWLRIRRENTSRMIQILGLPDERAAELLDSPDETALNELLALAGECSVKELEFLAEANFPGFSTVSTDHSETFVFPSTETQQ